ncbi:hypothetical protein WDX82_005131 [Salmonella enterica]
MKAIAELLILISLGAFLAVPFAILVREAGGIFGLMNWMMIIIGTLGGAIGAFKIAHAVKSKVRRAGAAFLGAMFGLLISGVMASSAKDMHEQQCQETEGAFSRALSECDGPIGASSE